MSEPTRDWAEISTVISEGRLGVNQATAPGAARLSLVSESADCLLVVVRVAVAVVVVAVSGCIAASEAVLVVLFVSSVDLPVGFEVAFVLLESLFVCL